MNWSTRTLAALALIALVTLAGCSSLVGGADADAIAEQVQERHDAIEDMHGVQTTTIEGGDVEANITTEVWQRPPDVARQEVISASNARTEGDVTVQNGNTSWYYDSAANEVTRMNVSSGVYGNGMIDGDAIERMLDRFEVTPVGTDTVAGRETRVLELNQTDGNETLATYDDAKVWVDTEYWYPLKYEITVTSGEEPTTVSLTFEEIEFNTGIPDERFEFQPPEDAEVTTPETPAVTEVDGLAAANEETDFHAGEPAVSDRFSVESVRLMESGEDATVMATYESEDGTLTYTVNPGRDIPEGDSIKVGDSDGVASDLNGFTAVSVECDDVVHTVTSDDAGEAAAADALAALECT